MLSNHFKLLNYHFKIVCMAKSTTSTKSFHAHGPTFSLHIFSYVVMLTETEFKFSSFACSVIM